MFPKFANLLKLLTMTEDFKTPGQLIKQVLKERGLTQRTLAGVIGLSTSHISEIINGKRSVTASLASKISEYLEIPVVALIDLQTRSALERSIGSQETDLENAAKDKLAEYDKVICIKSLLKSSGTKRASYSEKLSWMENYYGISDPELVGEQSSLLISGNFRKSAKTGLDERMIATWVIKARAKAKSCKITKQYNVEDADFLIDDLAAALHRNENTVNKVHEILNSYGIGFAVVEKEPNASIDGYSFMMGQTPYIVITKRFDRIDNLAFTIMHELGHIVLGHLSESDSKINIYLGDNGEEDITPHERAANEFAADALIPCDLWRFAPSVPLWPQAIQRKYALWAEKNKLNQWIVLGRVSYETGMYRFKSDQSRKIHGEYNPLKKEGGAFWE